jgi:hypothetical protein
MQYSMTYTWAKARKLNFNADKVRREGKKFNPKGVEWLRSVMVSFENQAFDLKEWFDDNEVKKAEYTMLGVFEDRKERMFYSGLLFTFTDDNTAMMFKLRFC